LNITHSSRIIQNAVSITEPRWREYTQKWQDIDYLFIAHGYEQQGFRIFKLVPLLKKRGIFSVDVLGSILSSHLLHLPYRADFAKGVDSEFYRRLRIGDYGEKGKLFDDAVMHFYMDERKNCGRFYWKLLWYLLQACSYLRNYRQSSFKLFIINEYRLYCGNQELSETQFLEISETEWRKFTSTVQPWKPLKGIGENVFDFIVGVIIEAIYLILRTSIL
jgi:hypothetical protein